MAQSDLISTLYVGDLHHDVNEKMIYEKFSKVGSVQSIRLCRDKKNRKSLGYAYVNYLQQEDAERALETLNFGLMKGRAIRIMWCQRDPSFRKSDVGNIFVKNLNKCIDQKEFYDTFAGFGNILSCKIATDETGKSRGHGFVHFETEEAALAATNKINGMMFKGKEVFVGKFIPRDKHDNAGEKKFTNVFVKNFGQELDDDKLFELFANYGEITSAKVMTDENGKPAGFGFVCFKDPDAAESAVDALNGLDVNGRALFCGPAQKKAERQNEMRSRFEKQKMERSYVAGVNLYVKNLDDSFDDERLKNEFVVFGNITSAKVMTDHTGKSKKFGFVCFSNPEEALKAVIEMNGKMVGTQPLYVVLSQKKEDRRQQLASQYMQRMASRFPNTNHPIEQTRQSRANYMMQQMSLRQQAFMFHQMPRGPTPIWSGPHQSMPGNRMSSNFPMFGFPNGHYKPGTHAGRDAQQIFMAEQLALNGNPLSPAQTRTEEEQPRIGSHDPINTAMLAVANPQEQKQMIGVRLYPLVHEINNELAGKITGLLLEIDNAELLYMLQSPELLKAKVDEALSVLQVHQSRVIVPPKTGCMNEASSDIVSKKKNRKSPPNENSLVTGVQYKNHNTESDENFQSENETQSDENVQSDLNTQYNGAQSDEFEEEIRDEKSNETVIDDIQPLHNPDISITHNYFDLSRRKRPTQTLHNQLHPLVHSFLSHLADQVTDSLALSGDELLLYSEEKLKDKIKESLSGFDSVPHNVPNETLSCEDNNKTLAKQFVRLFCKKQSAELRRNHFCP